MSQLSRALALAALAALPLNAQQAPTPTITAAGIRGHVSFLSADGLAGRAPGTAGAEIAAQYIASRFMAAGLEPVDGSYHQPVPLTGVTVDPTTVSLAFEAEQLRVPARYPTDAVVWPGRARAGVQVAGELVFVGYGIDAPERGWNDFKGRDLTGKILVFLVGDPPAPPEEPDLFDGRALTYYGRWTYKLEEAERRGATGALLIHRAETAGYDWNVVVGSWTGERLTLAPAEAGSEGGVMLNGWLEGDFANRLFEQAGLDLDELIVRAARRDFRPVPTGLTVRSRMNARSRAIESRNVIGHLPGRTDELVVFTAHYDHLGVGPAVDGDSIYNGAYDNASGVSALLEVARAFARLEQHRRGLLFIATTAEEAGMLGAHHYVRQPLFPLESTVAAINLDGVSLWGATADVIAVGAQLSSLQASVEEVAAELGLVVREDPVPERGALYRSDHFPFARAGVPAVHLQHGLQFRGRPAGWGAAMMAEWLAEHYHRPSDEFDPDADLSGAVQQAQLLLALGRAVANGAAPPEWRMGDRSPFPPEPGARR